MGEAGWFDDPSGRFGRRWHDGSAWSEHVVGANGTVTSDPLNGPDVQAPPPPAPPPPAPPPPAAAPAGYGPPPGYAPPPGYGYGYGPAGPRPRFRPGLGLAIAAAGLIAVAVSLFGPSWIDGSDRPFRTLSSNARDASLADGAKAHVQLAYGYFTYGGYVVFGLTVVLVAVGLVPLPPTSHAPGRILGSIVAGVGGFLHAAAFGQIASDDRTVVAYLGFAGFYAVIVGFAVGVREVGSITLTGQRAVPAPPPGLPT